MNVYENDFTYGQSHLKKLLYAAVASAVISLFLRANPPMQMLFFVITFALFIAIFVVLIEFCRCSRCGKIIFFGALAVTTCPRCKRNLVTGKKVKKSKR